MVAGEIRLVRVADEQPGAVARGRVSGEPERPPKLRRRFPVGARRGCPLAGPWSEPEHGFGVARGFGVMGQPGDIGSRMRGKGLQRPSVQLERPIGRKPLLHGQAGQLDSRGQAFVEMVSPARASSNQSSA